MAIRILKLDHKNKISAQEIYRIFQASYAVEAKLLAAENFPPLSITAQELSQKNSLFFGALTDNVIAGVIEFEIEDKILDICSLVVLPNFFRRGIGNALTSYVLEKMDWELALVETGKKNIPAIKLYERLGFQISKTFTPDHGIEKVALKKRRKK